MEKITNTQIAKIITLVFILSIVIVLSKNLNHSPVLLGLISFGLGIGYMKEKNRVFRQ
jgi:uncharacterized membrane protein